MENLWLKSAKRLQSIASTGIHFCTDEFDKERYEEVAQIANYMLAQLGNVPIERIQGLVSDFAQGYATPKVDVRGAVIKDSQILLVKEASDDLWTLPGGFADVGISAGENVVKEIREEASIDVRASAIYGIRHKAKHEYDPDTRDFYKFLFICEPIGACFPKPGHEVTKAKFFSLDRLPPLSASRILEKDIRAAFKFQADAGNVTFCD